MRWSALMRTDLSGLDLDAPLECVETDRTWFMVAVSTTMARDRT